MGIHIKIKIKSAFANKGVSGEAGNEDEPFEKAHRNSKSLQFHSRP